MKKPSALLLTLFLLLTVAAVAGAATLTWTGSAGAASNVWNVGTTANWRNGGTPAVFNNNDAVTFDDTGLTNPVVNLTTTVMPAAVTVNSASDYTFTNSSGGGLAGSCQLIKLGSSQLNLRSANTYSGGTTGGGIRIFDANALGTGVLTLTGFRLTFGADVGAGNGGLGITNDIVVAEGASVNINTYDFANKLSGKISGAGTLNGNGFTNGSLTLNGDNSGWSGGFNFIGSISLYLGHTNTLGSGPVTMTAGLLPVVSAATDLSGGRGVTNPIVMSGNPLTINLTNNLLLSGPISGSSNLVKSGSATLILGGNNTFTGGLAVSNGTLLVNGSISNGTVAVMTGATLGGSGTINGPATIQGGGILAPGAVSIGILTISNNLTMSGGLTVKINKGQTQSNDLMVVTGVLTNAGTGTITVTNFGPVLAVGDSFKLFSQPLLNGGAVLVNPVPGAGMVWTNRLAINGTIAVIVAPVPATNLVIMSVSPASFRVSGLGGANQAYTLYASTNLTVPMSNWWRILSTNADAGGVIQILDTQATNAQRFYRFGQ